MLNALQTVHIILHDISRYKQIKNNLKCLIRSAKLEYLGSLLRWARQTPQFAATLWSEVNNVIGHKVCQTPWNDSNVSLEGVDEFFRTVAITDVISLLTHLYLLLPAAAL